MTRLLTTDTTYVNKHGDDHEDAFVDGTIHGYAMVNPNDYYKAGI
jgi:hypothetical protein